VSRRLLAAALALGLAACSGEPAPEPAPAAKAPTGSPWPQQAPTLPAAPGPTTAPAQAAEAPAAATAAARAQPLAPAQLVPGISREQLLATLADCARRTHLTRASGAGSRTVESFQPKDAACVKTFGERHFVVAGDRVHSIEPGLREEDRPVESNPAASDSYRPPAQ